jgi:type IV secretory pathway VirB3-like protein
MQDFYEPVYKGCTSPGTMFGVPMLPFIVVTMGFAQAAVLLFVMFQLAGLAPLAVIYAAVFRWARAVSRNDDQRLLQLVKRIKARRGHRPVAAFWGAVSYAPFDGNRHGQA